MTLVAAIVAVIIVIGIVEGCRVKNGRDVE